MYPQFVEYRIVLTDEEAIELSSKLIFLETGFVKDEYTGGKRIRTTETEVLEKEYKTPVKGTVYRFSSKCKLGNIDNVWFEFKWTDKRKRFEIEFESDVPEIYKNRLNIHGWEILK